MLEWNVGPVLAALAAVLAAVYLYSTLVALRYWEKRGIPHVKPSPFLGSLAPTFFKKVPLFVTFREWAEVFKRDGFCGWYFFHKPILLVWDLEMAKQILVKEFSSFHDRGFPFDERDPLNAHLFSMTGPRWRNLRNKLSPTFTSGKLKLMFPLMRDVSAQLKTPIQIETQDNSEVEIGDVLGRFSADVIGTCAFGIQFNSLLNKESQFLRTARDIITKPSIVPAIRFVLLCIHPKLPHVFPFKFIVSKMHDFFFTLMRNTVQHRRENRIERNDFVNLMMQIQDSDCTEEDRENHVEITDSIMAAQGIIFFVAGMELVSVTLGFCLHHLAHDADLQRRAAEEVSTSLKEYDGQVTYEGLKKMDLVERILMEVLRLWSPNRVLFRVCTKSTVIGDLAVNRGEMVLISTENIHMNPEIYPEPSKFDPDRFTPEAVAARHPFAYLPFGEGPRVCIAERFAMIDMKLALATLLNEFEFRPSSRNDAVLEIDTKSFMPKPKNGFFFNVRHRN